MVWSNVEQVCCWIGLKFLKNSKIQDRWKKTKLLNNKILQKNLELFADAFLDNTTSQWKKIKLIQSLFQIVNQFIHKAVFPVVCMYLVSN